ncbi:MAG TPA: tRNA lysidine(34) synthetase TilS [Aggregatilineales bacterium]|nr:tRNA lysidine(34) synthetase TilS [Aggregatilineales bacterium]
MLVEQVRAFCHQYHLFEPGPVVVAVSGGADSLTLLHVLIALREEFGSTLHVATLDHGLRGDAGAGDVAFVREISAQWEIPVSAGSADVRILAAQLRLGIEEAARRARYDFLAEVARGIGARTIAMGHNQNDQAETVLMHVIRGTGLAGLRGILPKSPLGQDKNIALVRPLLDTSRQDIEAYLRQLGIAPRVDETNTDLSYDRNAVRHRIMPVLEELRGVRKGLVRTARIARDDFDALHVNLPAWSMVPSGLSMPREVFAALHVAHQRIVLREGIARFTPELSVGFDQLEMLRHKVENVSWQGSLNVSSQLALIADRQAIRLAAPGTGTQHFPASCPYIAEDTRLAISAPGDYELGHGWRLRVERIGPAQHIEAQERRSMKAPERNPLSIELTLNEATVLELRTRLPGDRFRPQGMGGHTQKVQDLMVNLKVPIALRDRVSLLVVDGEIAWIVVPTPDGPRSRMAEGYTLPLISGELWRFTYLFIA